MLVNLAAAAVEVAEQVALVFVGRGHFDFHDRFEQDRAAFLTASLNAKMPAILNASSFESTSWNEPSTMSTFTSITW